MKTIQKYLNKNNTIFLFEYNRMNTPKYTNLTFTAKLSGSTGAELFKNKSDKKWVVKKASKGGGFKQTEYEAAADDIYQLLGIPVPTHFLDYDNKALILEYIEGLELGKVKKDIVRFNKAKKELQKGFVVDALLANHDVIGLNMDNILVPSDEGPAVRIDNGGSFTFRASGKTKNFGKVVVELDTMRNKNINPQAALIFGELSDTNIDTQIRELIIPNYDKILEKVPAEVWPNMVDRLNYLVERTTWMNSSKFKNTVVENEMPKYMVGIVQFSLRKLFFPDVSMNNLQSSMDKLNNILIDNKAVISGGFILKALQLFRDEKSVDIDIYVPNENAVIFTSEMKDLFKANSIVKHVVSDSPNSFFKKNGILSVTKFSRNSPEYAEMDIVEVNSDRTPIDVVKNFDLTFCENWYDGKNLYMTHPKDVLEKSGFVENHYLGILFKKNPVLINRILKYINRGFQVSIHNPTSKKDENITQAIKDGTFLKEYNVQPNNIVQSGIPKIENKRRNNVNPFNGMPPIKSGPQKAITSRKTNNSDLFVEYVSSEAKNKIVDVVNFTKSLNSLTVSESNLQNTEKLVLPINPSSVNIWDRKLISYYTGSGYRALNRYLYSNTSRLQYLPNILKDIMNVFNKKFGNKMDALEGYYYYFVNLYNAIQKYPSISKPFIVMRGATEWYLPSDNTKMNYLNNFTSTTTNIRTVITFGRNNRYIFYVHPQCQYMNITSISPHKSEKEILLNPYNRVFYIKSDGIKQFFAVLPIDINIPSTYDEFTSWKDSHATITGGRVQGSIIQNTSAFYNMNNSKGMMLMNGSMKNLKSVMPGRINKTSKNKSKEAMESIQKNTMAKNNTRKNTSNVSKGFIERMTEPISTFPGKAPTDAEKKVIDAMVKYFEG